jgi:hypothetical protein
VTASWNSSGPGSPEGSAEEELDNPRSLALPDWDALQQLGAALVARSHGRFAGWADIVEFTACTVARIGERRQAFAVLTSTARHGPGTCAARPPTSARRPDEPRDPGVSLRGSSAAPLPSVAGDAKIISSSGP